jgi:PRC-barrel domain
VTAARRPPGRSGLAALALFVAMLVPAALIASSRAAFAQDQTPEPSAAPEAKPDTKSETAPETKPVPASPPVSGTPPQNLQLIYHGEATSILGKKVQGAAGEDMGRVVDILVDADGQPRAAVIDFGGFLGVGSRKIAVDWHLLQFRPTDRKAPMQLAVTRADVQAAPEYKEKNEPTQVVAPPPDAPAPPVAPK